jgi:uncharacterized protein YehS (DUF1456 family)
MKVFPIFPLSLRKEKKKMKMVCGDVLYPDFLKGLQIKLRKKAT